MEKVQNAVDKLQGDLKDYVQAKVEELKPVVIEKLNNAKQIVIDGATKIYIEIKDQIARIITGVTSAVSGSEAYGIKDKLKGGEIKITYLIYYYVIKRCQNLGIINPKNDMKASEISEKN